MTSTALINNQSKKINFHTPFWANFYMNLKSLKKILIVMCVLHILGLPLLFITSISETIDEDFSMYGFIPLSVCCTVCALFCGFIIALNSFDYLYKKSKVDMIYSLPLTIKQRFLSDYFSGLCAYTIPYIITVILILIIHALSCFGFDKWEEYNNQNHITTYLLKIAIGGLLILIMFYTLTVLVTSCCGSMFEAITYNIFVNGLIPGVITVFFLVFFDNLYGINVDEYLLRYVSNSSPIGACIGIFENIESDIIQLMKWYLLTLIADVVYFFIAYFLYSKRKAEDVSKPFVFKAFYYITMTTITFIIIALMIYSDDTDYILPMLLISAIVYFICEVISNRGFKGFGWSILRYIATVCGVVVLCLILKGTKGFGIENRVPSINSIKSVSISYNGIYSNEEYYGYPYEKNEVTFSDKETIQTIIDFHKDAVENRFKTYIPEDGSLNYYYDYEIVSSAVRPDDCSDYYNYISINYNTKLGGKISREYKVSFEQYMMLKDLSLKKEYIEKNVLSFKESLLNSYRGSDFYYDYYYKSNNNNPTIPVENRNYYISEESKIKINYKEYDNLTYAQIMELVECYAKDLQNRTLDDILTPNDTYCYLNDYVIFSSYENTIKFLTENKLTPPTLQAELQAYNSYDSGYYGDCILYSPDDITCVGGDYYTSINGYRATNRKYLTVNNSLLELLEVAQPNYVTTDECYILRFNGNMFVIPKEHTALAEKIYNGSSNDYIQTVVNCLEYDYLDCYLNVHDIWKKYFTNTYEDYEYFVDRLIYGNVDIFTDNISSTDYDVLKKYYDYYWIANNDSVINDYWQNLYEGYWQSDNIFEFNGDYYDFVWYIIMYNFNNADDSILFNDDIVTSKEDIKEDTTTDTQTTTQKENPKIDDKPIDENLSNI